MIDIAVIGSGISGLSVAWHLSKKGFEVKVFEKEDLPGGNIQTVKKDGFILELGPQTILADKRVEEFLSGAGIEPEYASERAKIRYIYKTGELLPHYKVCRAGSKPAQNYWGLLDTRAGLEHATRLYIIVDMHQRVTIFRKSIC